MREIKFRAWQIGQNTMIPFDKIEYLDLLDSQINIRITWEENEAMEETLTLPLSEFELMQYTGLKDKNGKDIYEGDIIVVDNGSYSGSVKFNKEDLSYVIENETGGFGFANGQTYDERPEFRTYEVIGNIYENPELLKESEGK